MRAELKIGCGYEVGGVKVGVVKIKAGLEIGCGYKIEKDNVEKNFLKNYFQQFLTNMNVTLS